MICIVRFNESGRLEYMYDPSATEDGESWSHNAEIAYQYTRHDNAVERFNSMGYDQLDGYYIMNVPSHSHPMTELKEGQLVTIYKKALNRKSGKEAFAVLVEERSPISEFSKEWDVKFLKNSRSVPEVLSAIHSRRIFVGPISTIR